MFPIDEDDPPDVEHYNNNGFVYESQYLGLLSIYHTATGCQDFQLISSHDGENWERAADRAVFLPSGRPYCDWDFGTTSVPGTSPVLIGDELWFHYSGRWNIHGSQHPEHPQPRGASGGAIGVAKLRRDGFVSLDAGSEEAVVVTKPLVLKGDMLKINVDCPDGSLSAEVLDENGDVITGFGRRECEPVATDNVNHRIQWRGERSLRDLGGKNVQLRFSWRNGSLYSFWTERGYSQ